MNAFVCTRVKTNGRGRVVGCELMRVTADNRDEPTGHPYQVETWQRPSFWWRITHAARGILRGA